uniref:Integrase catalytic domain-containing protein n=1 Tax=Fagus sylvatica TaxID=28930 RepID=A0A2N9FY74_FAGSY
MLMENFLRSKEYWSLVETGVPAAAEGVELTEAQQKTIADQKLKDLKVKNYLFQAIDRTIMETILNRDTAKHIWDSMKQKYQGSTRVKRAQLQALRKEFEVLQMKEGESVDAYFARTLIIANKMKIHGENMQQVVIIEKILRSMTSRFDYVVCSVEESNNLDILTIDELQSSLLVHEQRMNGHGGDEQALKVTYDDRTGGRGGGRTHGVSRGRGRQAFNKAIIECYKCHQLGHFQYECPKWEKEANYAELEEKEEMLLMSYVELNQSRREDVWFLDSGCSNHMCANKEWFSDLDEEFRESVKLGNNSKMAVLGKGNIRLQIAGVTQVITDVFYIPELKNNLLSIGQLQERGVALLIQHGVCRVYHPKKGLIMQTAMSANRMFILLARILPKAPTCFQTILEDNTHLWHCRYGHLSFKGLRTLQYKQMVKGLPQLKAPSKICTDCMVGKQHRDAIPKRSLWRASQRLQLVHADICGPIKPVSNSKKRYFISFIDDYSRKVWIYFLAEKSEAFTIFKNYKNLVEKETGAFIRCLRTDRGGEFNSDEFKVFCKTNGISRQLTAAYTPQQNGVAERKNRTIMNMVRSMLSEKQIPKNFWPEAVNWTAHVLNRSPTLAVKDMTPEEAWSGIKPNVDYFRVFGCIGHVHVSDSKRKKLDDKSFQCVLLGMSEESKAYRLYDPASKKIVVSRDVFFEESECWDWGRSNEEARLDILEWEDSNEEGSEHDQSEEESEEEVAAEEEGGEVSLSSSESPGENSPTSEESSPEGRNRRVPFWMEDYSSKWSAAMDLEIEAIERNGTWELTDLPKGMKKIGVKWVFKTKLNENGEVDKCKARLVAKGYAQQYGIDYTEVFAPVARWDTIRMIIALAARNSWSVFQLDVKSAFLHGELNEAVFVEQPQGYEKKGEEYKVYKLKKALYGLKQAPRAWYSRIEAYFVKEGFESMFVKFKNSMKLEFDMTDLGKMKYFLGVEVLQNPEGIYISQRKYAKEVLERFRMENSNSVKNPIVPGVRLMKDEEGAKVNATMYKQLVGSLMYLTATRPDLMYVVSLISRFMASPTELHLQAAKRVLRYLKGTVDLGVFYRKKGNGELMAYTDSDYAGDVDDRKSTSGYVFLLSEGAVSWSSKKQPVVTLSTTEAEFVAAASCACQGVWMRRVLEKLGHPQGKCTTVLCDNSSTIKLSKNPVMHGRSKHIDVRFHFLRDSDQRWSC